MTIEQLKVKLSFHVGTNASAQVSLLVGVFFCVRGWQAGA
jgi:hypothetical protein